MKLMVRALLVAVLVLSVANGIQWSNLSKARAHSRATTCDAIEAVDNGIINIITPSKADYDASTKAQQKRVDAFIAKAKNTFVPPVYCKTTKP